jgi:CheY-like chemotaxis protein/anti-sigma regulatory factor (Ser/Thr protein kinase)
VLMNLVGNAIKFTDQGTVGVELRTGRSGDGCVRVSLRVRDTGVGFDDQVRLRLFEPFFQDREATKHGGSGLGLSICERIVRQMGGHIVVESQPGRGSLFQIELVLPAADQVDAQDAADSAPRAEDTLRLRGHVLLVDDNLVNRTIATEMLRSLGLEVDGAADGAQALRRLADRDYDLVLMDVEMPVLDGHATSRAQRERERRLTLPRTTILALTANAFAEDVAAALDAGMDGHIAKPFTLAQLRDALAARLRSSAPQPVS